MSDNCFVYVQITVILFHINLKMAQKRPSSSDQIEGIHKMCRLEDQGVNQTPQMMFEKMKAYSKIILDQTRSSNMVLISSVDEVIKTLQAGHMWVTLTGNPGDGKSTLGYIVLNELQKLQDENSGDGKPTSIYIDIELQKLLDENLYLVNKPEELTHLMQLKGGCTIMLDDIFGRFSFDQRLLNEWTDCVRKIIESPYSFKIRVIFICRLNFLQERKMIPFWPSNKYVDLSTVSEEKDRIGLLNHHFSGDQSLSDDDIRQIAAMEPIQGFPFYCTMYRNWKVEKFGSRPHFKAFFKDPIPFFHQSTKTVVENERYRTFFKKMMTCDGKIDVYRLDYDERSIAEELNEWYVQDVFGVIEFTHSTIYERVAYEIGKKEELWLVENASLSLIKHIVNIIEGNGKLSDRVNIYPRNVVLSALCLRFREELLDKEFSVFEHKFCDIGDFCEILVDTCVKKTKHPSEKNTELINETNKWKHGTMLMIATLAGKSEAILALAKCGADVNRTDNDRMTPLHHMCNSDTKDPSTIQALIGYVSNVNQTDHSLMTPLHHLCKSGTSDASIIKVLIASGSDVNQTDRSLMTPLHHLCKSGKADAKTAQLLIKSPKSVNQTDYSGLTPLHHMCKSGTPDASTIKVLIASGSDVNKTDQNYLAEKGSSSYYNRQTEQMTPLNYLCKSGKADITTIELLATHTNVNNENCEGMTPLHHLCKSGKADTGIVQTLIDKGADVHIHQNRECKTALRFLEDRGEVSPELVQLLK